MVSYVTPGMLRFTMPRHSGGNMADGLQLCEPARRNLPRGLHICVYKPLSQITDISNRRLDLPDLLT